MISTHLTIHLCGTVSYCDADGDHLRTRSISRPFWDSLPDSERLRLERRLRIHRLHAVVWHRAVSIEPLNQHGRGLTARQAAALISVSARHRRAAKGLA
jgi:hypothetical protein